MESTRNKPCRCGSGKKYKKCCLPVERREQEEALRRLYTPPVVGEQANTLTEPSPYRFRHGNPSMLTLLAATSLCMGGIEPMGRK